MYLISQVTHILHKNPFENNDAVPGHSQQLTCIGIQWDIYIFTYAIRWKLWSSVLIVDSPQHTTEVATVVYITDVFPTVFFFAQLLLGKSDVDWIPKREP